jgi:tripartite-type tricarboxylate transporter receptor subunit TctC
VHDLNAGRIHVMIATLATMNTPLETGSARLLAVTNSDRLQTAPDVPTAKEAGFPTLTVDGLFGFFGWRRMPSELRDRIAADVGQAAQDPALASRLANVGLIVTAGTTNELAVAMAEQRTQVDNVASILGLHRPGREGGR